MLREPLVCVSFHHLLLFDFVFFNDTATTEIYTLSLHDALPICRPAARRDGAPAGDGGDVGGPGGEGRGQRWGLPARPAPARPRDRKSTRLNSSHANISDAVFCLKKKKRSAPSNRSTWYGIGAYQ